MKKTIQLVILLLVLATLCWFFPKLALFLLVFLVCGIYDVLRNRKLDGSVIKRYFLGNGILTWVLSPFNTFLDILCLPYINKGVYQLEDLPKGHQVEIQRLIDAAHKEDLVGQLQKTAEQQSRSMFFFKWYGANMDTLVDVPAFHEKYKYIKTIGISVFNKKQSTSKHFGPFRATLRVLYNVNDIPDQTAWIDVGDVSNYWQDSKLFIFDDTLMHQSFNESNRARYCLFVDILRPSLLSFLLAGVIGGIRVVMQPINSVFYKNWKVVRKSA